MLNKYWTELFVGITLCTFAHGRPDIFIPQYDLPQGPVILQHHVPMQQILVPQYINIPVQFPPGTGQIYQIPVGYTWQHSYGNHNQPPVNNQGPEFTNVQTVQKAEEDASNSDYSSGTQVPETTEYFDGNSREDNQQQRQSALFVEALPTNSGGRPTSAPDQLHQTSNVNEVRVPNVRSRLGYQVNEATGSEQEPISQQYRKPLLATANQPAEFDVDKQTQQQQQQQAKPTRLSNVMSMLPHKREEIDFSEVLKKVHQEVHRKMADEQQPVGAAATHEETHFMGMTSNNHREKLTYVVDGS